MSFYSSIPPRDSTVDAGAKSSAPTLPKRSLYDGLDAEMAGATVASKAPVTYDLSKREASKLVPEESEKKQMISAALQFQPVIRSRSTQSTVAPNKVVTVISKPPTVVPRPVSAVTLGKFATDEAGTTEYARVKQHGRSSRKRKKRKDDEDIQAIDWESAYDPLRPNNYDEYLQSEEKFMEDEDWREFLLNLKKRREEGSVSQENEEMEVEIKEENADVKDASRMPTSEAEDDETPSLGRLDEQSNRSSTQPSFVAPISFMASYQDEQSSTSIAKAPVIFTGAKEGHNEGDESDYIPPPPPSPPSNKPREKTAKETFAKRLLTKYGWTPGTGLGATSGGITKALHFSADKSMKGHGKIVDKNMRKTDEGKFGAMSKVIVLFGIVQPDQLDEDLAGDIGTECGSKYGNVERVYIDKKEDTVNAYVKFTAELSALRAVNGLDGRLFGGNPIVTRFVDEMDFENGNYL
ncbi:hypothetical protein V1517DRAFT_127131 [Lipomyces orientalis]|uniref:Uncharacterized protein n=1 Tax=Lipomyces orientalis TaxID=1233043 RepID=A0ACC3TY45_9ASCO